MLVIRNGLIHDAINREPYTTGILIENGKIIALTNEIPADAQVIDASGKNICPGFVDAHTHVGVAGTGIGYEGSDYNELNDYLTPQMRAIDSVNPFDPSFAKARNAGVTTVATGPGSANSIGGIWAAFKTVGKSADQMVVRDPIAMKCAFGENPKSVYRTKGISARMSNAARIREMLFASKQYLEKKEAAGDDPSKMPAFDFKKEAMIPVLKKEIPLKAHAHQANDILTAIRIAKEFDLKLTLEHVTEGHLIADILAKENYPLAVGPTLSHASKPELRNKSWQTAGILANKGCTVSIVTDHPFSMISYLPVYAGYCVKEGMDAFDALKAITINPARHILCEDRIGSIEAGKDADLVIYEGDLFSSLSVIHDVLIDGRSISNQ